MKILTRIGYPTKGSDPTSSASMVIDFILKEIFDVAKIFPWAGSVTCTM